jgi:hypothetical protein
VLTIATTPLYAPLSLRGPRMPWQLPWITEYWDGNIGITVTGSGVSTWAPIKGTNSLTQGTDSARPPYSDGVLTFSGTQTISAAFTLNAPYSVLLVASQTAWNSGARFSDGKTNNSFSFQQFPGSPQVRMTDAVLTSPAISPPLSNYIIICATQDVAGNVTLQYNLNAAVTGTMSITGMAGLTLGSSGNGSGGFFTGTIKSAGYGNTAWSAEQITQAIRAAARTYGISV